MVVGLGLLATGSGATFTSAAFNASTSSTGDIRVVTGKGLIVEAGNAFLDDGEVNNTKSYSDKYVNFTNTGDFFDDSGSTTDLDQIDIDDLPVATVNPRDGNSNGDVILRVAVDPATNTTTFNNILRIRNIGDSDQDNVGIAYKSDDFTGYGSAVSNSNDISNDDVKGIIQFKAGTGSGKSIISPVAGVIGSGEAPYDPISIGAGETADVNLIIGEPVIESIS